MVTLNRNLLPIKYIEVTISNSLNTIVNLGVTCEVVIGAWNQASGDNNKYQSAGVNLFIAGGTLYYINGSENMKGRTLRVYYI